MGNSVVPLFTKANLRKSRILCRRSPTSHSLRHTFSELGQQRNSYRYVNKRYTRRTCSVLGCFKARALSGRPLCTHRGHRIPAHYYCGIRSWSDFPDPGSKARLGCEYWPGHHHVRHGPDPDPSRLRTCRQAPPARHCRCYRAVCDHAWSCFPSDQGAQPRPGNRCRRHPGRVRPGWNRLECHLLLG